MKLTEAEQAEVLAALRSRFPDVSDDEIVAAMEGRTITPDVDRGAESKRFIHGMERELSENSDLDECLEVAKDAFEIAMEAAKVIEGKLPRMIAETAARIAYAVGRAFCRAEYG